MLTGKLFVICGVSRLAARVARSLRAMNAEITVIMYEGESESLAQVLSEYGTLRRAAGENAAETLRAVGVARAECVLAVAEEDLVNLRSTVCARSVAPDVPVVIRAFDPQLADQFEQGLNVRRAFSVSALAAPAFAAAACGADVVESLRLGDEVVPIYRLHISQQSHPSGVTVRDLREVWGVTLVGFRRGGEWILAADSSPDDILGATDELVVSGAPGKCTNLLAHAAGWHHRRRMAEAHGHRGAVEKRLRRRRARRSLTWLPRFAATLLVMVLIAIVVFERELHLRTVDAVYFVITTLTTTGYGDITLRDAPDWVKMFGGLIMLSGGAMLGVIFSYLASIATAERLDIAMERRAEQMSNHIVVIGLGNVGYRVGVALTDLGIDVAVLDLAPQARFRESMSARAPVLTGDARLPETLERVSMRTAAAIIACTSDDLANIEACLHARRMNPTIRTVARVYDDQIVETLSSAFNIDAVLSATHAAESSFVIAATDAAALRPLDLPGLRLVAGRFRSHAPITTHDVQEWRNRGIQALAFRPEGAPVTSHLAAASTYEAILCGPEEAVRGAISAQPPRNRLLRAVSIKERGS